MKRFNEHIRDLNGNYHHNKHLQSAWNKYGEDSFTFDILEECTQDKLNEREMYWIDYYNSYKSGYNKSLGGEGTIGKDNSGENNPMYGKHHTEEAKRKMSEAHKGKNKRTPEMYEDIKNGMSCRAFIEKYNSSRGTYYPIKKEIKEEIELKQA